jgi:hypothetical protein
MVILQSKRLRIPRRSNRIAEGSTTLCGCQMCEGPERGTLGRGPQVWPGACHFPDFMHPEGQAYWLDMVKDFYDMVPFDGLWVSCSPLVSV